MTEHCNRCAFLDSLDDDLITALAPNELQIQMEKLDTEISRAEETLTRLSQKRASLKRRKNYLRSLVLRLHPEILVDIFLLSFPYNATTHWVAKTPLVLGKICSSWREIAWATPQLWRTVSLAVDKNHRYSGTEAILLDEWLMRAAQLPLSIKFDQLSPYGTDFDGPASFTSCIARYSEQWEHVRFDLHQFFDPSLFTSSGFPLLKSISVKVHSGGSIGELFRYAPQLREISLQGFDSPLSITFPSAQPLRLKIINTETYECLKILHLNPNIIHYEAKRMWDSPREELAGTPFDDLVLPQLESLTINFAQDSGFFDHLTTPALRNLFFDDGSVEFPYVSLMSFVTRSACPLLRLSLSYQSISDISILVEFLTIMPTLVSLELLDIDMVNRLTQSLDASAAGPLLLPNLQRFTFRGSLWGNFTDLASLLASRWRRNGVPGSESIDDDDATSIARLEFAFIDITYSEIMRDEGADDEMRAQTQFRQLKFEGMDIQVINMGVSLD